jgi:hypothetical protein
MTRIRATLPAAAPVRDGQWCGLTVTEPAPGVVCFELPAHLDPAETMAALVESGEVVTWAEDNSLASNPGGA